MTTIKHKNLIDTHTDTIIYKTNYTERHRQTVKGEHSVPSEHVINCMLTLYKDVYIIHLFMCDSARRHA